MKSHERKVEQTLEELKRRLERARYPITQMEDAIGVGRNYLWRRLNGDAAMDLGVLYAVLEELEIDILEFFVKATMDRIEAPSPSRGAAAGLQHFGDPFDGKDDSE